MAQVQNSRLTLRTLLPLAAAYGSFLLALSVDIVLLYDTGLLKEGPPRFDTIYLLRNALIALSSGLLVFGLARGWSSDWGSETVLEGDGQGLVPGLEAGWEGSFSKKTNNIILWVCLALSTGFLLLFLFDPHAFYQLGKEDNFIEAASALAWFLSALVFFRVAYLHYRAKGKIRSTFTLIPLLLALACFLVSMEEISWFQRVFSFTTPDFIVENVREEINFHNYATDEVENVYYLSTFLAFIFLPYLVRRNKIAQVPRRLRIFIPSQLVLLVSSLAVAYNYDMWNILFTQLSFFVTIFILFALIKFAVDEGGIPYTVIGLVVTICLSQGLFLLFGDRFVRTWDVTEYKELFIPLAVIFYSLEVLTWVRALETGQYFKRPPQATITNRLRKPSQWINPSK